MGHRYYFEITDRLSPYYCFAYVDTEEYLAHVLFIHEKVDVTIEQEFGADGDPYRIILCKVSREQRNCFLHAIELLPGLMAYAGYADYEEYCRNFFRFANRWIGEREISENMHLQ